MSDISQLKGHCQQCGGTIEFPSHDAGLEASCPYCNELTLLIASDEAPMPSVSALPAAPSSSKRKMVVIVLLMIAAVMVAGTFLFRGTLDRAPGVEPSSALPTQEVAAVVETPVLPTNPPAPAKAPKSIDDLKVGSIALEKARGSSLVYAVGVLRNDSSHQRFGVTLELELSDAQGRPAGTAKDYRAVLEPRQEWRFRALVLDSKAVAAKVAAIREE